MKKEEMTTKELAIVGFTRAAINICRAKEVCDRAAKNFTHAQDNFQGFADICAEMDIPFLNMLDCADFSVDLYEDSSRSSYTEEDIYDILSSTFDWFKNLREEQ